MSLKVDKVQLEIILKSDSTRAEINKLEDQAKSLKKQMNGLNKETEEYQRLSAEYGKVKKRIDDLRNSIDLNAKTMRELNNRARELRSMLNNLTPGTEEWIRFDAELKQVNGRLRELRGSSQHTETSFSKMANGFNKYFGMATAAIATITGLSFTFRKLAEDIAKMDDVYSDVMKTTGMTRDEVLELNEEFKKMDTRTGREQLNHLARDAGKLGLSGKKDILDFVEAGNQINVALGEDLGEDAIKNIGKMVGVFDKSTEHLKNLDLKGQMLSVASAVNDLGASSSANEDYLVQFAGRIGGIATQAGLSIDEILGFASALDQDMQQVEMSATALQNFIVKIMGEPAKFAKIAGKDVKEFSELLKTAPNEAIKAVLKSLGDKGGLAKLIPIFKDMGLDGARAAQVISTMANSLDKIDEAQRIANESMIEGTSASREYSIKNENLAAKLEKARKNFNDISLELGQSLNPILLKSTSITTNLIKLLVNHPGLVKTLIAAIALLSLAYASHYAIKIKVHVLDKLHLALTNLQRIASLSLAAAQALLTGNLIRARAAMSMLNKTMLINPYLAVTAVIAGLGLAIYKLATRTTEAQKAYNEFTKEANAQSRELKNVFEAYKRANEGTKEKDRLLKIIKEKYGKYIQDLIDEKGNIIDIEKAQVQANKALRESIALKIKEQAVSGIVSKETKEQSELLGEINKAIAKEKGQSIANLVTESIAEAFTKNEKDAVKGLKEAKQILDKHGIKGGYGWNLEGQKTYSKTMNELFSSFFRMNLEQEKIDQKFAGLISKAAELNTIVDNGGGEDDNDDKDDDNNLTPDDKKKDKQKDPFDQELKRLEETAKLRELYWRERVQDEKELEDILLENKINYLDEKLELEKQYGKSTLQTQLDILSEELKQEKNADEVLLANLKLINEAKLTALTEFDNLERQKLQDQVDDGIISRSEYNRQLAVIELTSAQSRLQIAQDYLKDVNDAEFKSAEEKKKAVDDATKAVEQAAKAEQTVVERSNRAKLKADDEYKKEREALLKQYGLLSMRQQYDQELAELQKSLKQKLLTEEEYAQAVKQLKLKYAEEGAQKAVQFAGYVADAVTAYHQMEADSLEAEKQRELAAAGDNAEERERIEQAYAQKELDLKKKQANADAGIKIAQTVAAGALAVIQAFGQLGPIGGAIAAALIATTTAFQIASIIKQRNAIMATTLDTSSSSDKTKETGVRVANSQLPTTPQAVSGRWDVIGEEDGRTYKNVPYLGIARTGVVSTPTLVGEQGDEVILDNPTVRNIRMNAPYLLGMLNEYRVPQRASGKWDSLPSNNSAQSEQGAGNSQQQEEYLEVMREMIALLSYLKENGIHAYTILSEFEKARDLRDKSLKKGSLS